MRCLYTNITSTTPMSSLYSLFSFSRDWLHPDWSGSVRCLPQAPSTALNYKLDAKSKMAKCSVQSNLDYDDYDSTVKEKKEPPCAMFNLPLLQVGFHQDCVGSFGTFGAEQVATTSECRQAPLYCLHLGKIWSIPVPSSSSSPCHTEWKPSCFCCMSYIHCGLLPASRFQCQAWTASLWTAWFGRVFRRVHPWAQDSGAGAWQISKSCVCSLWLSAWTKKYLRFQESGGWHSHILSTSGSNTNLRPCCLVAVDVSHHCHNLNLA